MKLWTWQNSVFNITDPSIPVDSNKHSKYEHKDKYQMIYNVLGTDQILWFYSSHEDAMSKASFLEYNGKMLWEIEVPKSCYGDIYAFCGYAWHWIISDRNATPPAQYGRLMSIIRKHIYYDHNAFCNDFNLAWKSQSKDALRRMLFTDLSTCRDGCPTIILKHPIGKSWIIKKQLHEDVFRKQ